MMEKTIIIKQYSDGRYKTVALDGWITDEQRLTQAIKKEKIVNRGSFLVAHLNERYLYITEYPEGIHKFHGEIVALDVEALKILCKTMGEGD